MDEPGQPQGRRKRSDAQRNRSRILAAARAAFIIDGVGVSLDEIASRAGVGPGTVYRHFPSKKELLGEVVSERLREVVARAEKLAASGDPATALFKFLSVSSLLDLWQKMPLIISDVFAEVGDDEKSSIRDAWNAFENAIDVLIVQAQEAGAVRGDVAARDLIALLRGVFFATQHDGELLTRSWPIVLRGIQVPQPTEPGTGGRAARAGARGRPRPAATP
jgi:AcrR family transcriptional regulator